MAAIKNTRVTTIEAYFDRLPKFSREALEVLRQTIKKAAPRAEEMISYQMPYYKFHGRLAYCAAFKGHYSLFVMSNVLKEFKEQLGNYESTKATLHFPYGKPLPKKLVSAIIKYGVKLNEEKVALKQLAKSGTKKNNKRISLHTKY